VVAVADGVLLHSRSAYAQAMGAAARVDGASPELAPWEIEVLAAITCRSRGTTWTGAFSREVSRCG
jgi:shikimate kinase